MTTNTDKPVDMVNMTAFKAGYRAFFVGSKKPIEFTTAQKLDVQRRLKHLKAGGLQAANAIALKFKEQGYHLVDIYDNKGDAFPTETRGEVTTEAYNPFKPATYASKEWLRGFNAAYFKNIERNASNAGNSRLFANTGSRPFKRGSNPHNRARK